MSNDKTFQADPDCFQQIVANDAWEERIASAPTLDDLLCEVVRYGLFNKQEMIGPLGGLYCQLATDQFGKYKQLFGNKQQALQKSPAYIILDSN